MSQALSAIWAWLRVQFFRLWTALAVLGTYIYLWFYKPEYLTWWKRSTDRLVEGGSSQLPYPWGLRRERPQMCAGHELSDDKLMWTFALRDGLMFHDRAALI